MLSINQFDNENRNLVSHAKLIIIPPPPPHRLNEVEWGVGMGWGVYWLHLVRPSDLPLVHPSVRPSVTPTYPQKKVKKTQHCDQPDEVSNNKYICSSKKTRLLFPPCTSTFRVFGVSHSVCSNFSTRVLLVVVLLSHLSPSHLFYEIFIKSLSLLVAFLLKFRHGLSTDRSHVHLSIYKRPFYQEFQRSFENLLRKVGHIGLSHGCHVICRRSLIGCLP